MKDEASTAYHEAGHFVVHHHLIPGGTGPISIVPDDTSYGRHAPLQGLQDRARKAAPEEEAENRRLGATDPTLVGEYDRAEIQNYIVILYAGASAQLHHDPSSRRAAKALSDPTPREEAMAEEIGGDGEVDGSDWMKAEGWLSWLAKGAKRAALRRRLRERAKSLVKEHWSEIDAVSKALIARRHLDGLAAECILELAAGGDLVRAAHALAFQLGPEDATELLASIGVHVSFED